MPRMTARDIRAKLEEYLQKKQVGYRAASRSWDYKGRSLSERELVRRIAFEEGCSLQQTELAVAVWADDLKHEASVGIEAWLASVEAQPVDDGPLRAFLGALQRPDTPLDMAEAHVWAMKQWIWQVKRNIAKRPVTWQVLPIFWSQENGQGKSHNIRRLLEPVEGFTRSINVQELSERFNKKLLASTLVAFFDEFAGAGDIDKATFKAMITGRPLEGREMYSEAGFHAENRLACIATSNLAPPHAFEDNSGARRFWSIHCGSASRDDLAERHDALDALPWPDIWRAVSVTTPSIEALIPPHIAERMAQERNDRLRARDSFESFYREALEPADPEVRVPMKQVQEAYRPYLAATKLKPVRMSQEAMQDRLTGMGARCVNASSYRFLCGMRLKSDD